MIVLLDAHMLGEREGGNESYIAGLIYGFTQLQLTETFKITVLHNQSYRSNLPSTKHVEYQTLNKANNWQRVFITIPNISRQKQASLAHVTYNASPFMKCPVVATIHDVIFRIYPDFFSPRERLLLSTMTPLTMKRASSIITVSETSKNDIERFYPFTKGKVYVTPEAPGLVAYTHPDYAACDDLTQGREFILSVGTIQPRKNIARLVEAYIMTRRKGVNTARLLIVGRDGWQHSQIHRIAMESGYAEDIIFTGYVPNQVLSALYRKCLAFVYPSLYEGFGLPVIEAMACGAPVITSNVSSLPEVSRGAAILVDPYSIGEIAQAIESVINNRYLREELRQKGKDIAKLFNWKNTALETYNIYKEVVNNKK